MKLIRYATNFSRGNILAEDCVAETVFLNKLADVLYEYAEDGETADETAAALKEDGMFFETFGTGLIEHRVVIDDMAAFVSLEKIGEF